MRKTYDWAPSTSSVRRLTVGLSVAGKAPGRRNVMLGLGHVIDKFAFGGNKARANRDSIQYLVPIDLVAAAQKTGSGVERISTGDPR